MSDTTDTMSRTFSAEAPDSSFETRSASDAEPRIRMSIARPRRPPGLPELNALAQVIAMSVRQSTIP